MGVGWVRGFYCSFTNPVGIGEVCLCLGCGGVVGVCVELVGVWSRVLGVLLCLYEL